MTSTSSTPASGARLAIAGRGRAGGAIARAAARAGLEVSSAGRGEIATTIAAQRPDAALLCVPDTAIAACCAELAAATPLPRFVGHLSGVTGLEALAAAHAAGTETFSMHPLQTLPDPAAELGGSSCAVAGSSPAAVEFAAELARTLGMEPFELPEAGRAAYHAAASLASNFLITLEESARMLLEAAGVPDAHATLTPLVLRSAANWAERGAGALTGPIARGEEETVVRHRDAISEHAPELLALYDALADRTRALGAPGERDR